MLRSPHARIKGIDASRAEALPGVVLVMTGAQAIAAAVEDALRPLGVKVDALPITPMRVRELIREAAVGG